MAITREQRAANFAICAAWASELAARLQHLAQARRVKKTRGAWQRPALAGSATQLEATLLASYWRLAREVLAELRGVHHSQQAEEEPTTEEERMALAALGAPEGAAAEPVDRERLAAVLLLLSFWRRRHEAIADEAAGRVFHVGRDQALGQLGLSSAHAEVDTLPLRPAVIDRYRADIDRLDDGLLEGTPRSPGVRRIVEVAPTVGTVAALLRRLWAQEEFRVTMLAESLTWTAWQEGFRAGAVDGSRELARLGAPLPRFVWAGPADGRTCGPCRGRFGAVVEATSLVDLPLPEMICAFGRACRHWWQVSG